MVHRLMRHFSFRPGISLEPVHPATDIAATQKGDDEAYCNAPNNAICHQQQPLKNRGSLKPYVGMALISGRIGNHKMSTRGPASRPMEPVCFPSNALLLTENDHKNAQSAVMKWAPAQIAIIFWRPPSIDAIAYTSRRRTISNKQTAAAAATFSDSTAPGIGILMRSPAASISSARTPCPSAPNTQAIGPFKRAA